MKPSEAYRNAIKAVCTDWYQGRISTDEALPTLLVLTAQWDRELFEEHELEQIERENTEVK